MFASSQLRKTLGLCELDLGINKMAKVQIEKELFDLLVRFHVTGKEQEILYRDRALIRQGIEEKLQAMKLHNIYSESKNCKFKELREIARQLYLDEKGIHKDFWW